MKIEKIKRLIEILVEREFKRQLPIIKKQILSEMTISNSSQPRSTTHDFLTNYKTTKTKPVFKNPLLNEIMQSTKPLNDDVSTTDTLLSEVKSEQSKKVLDIMMRKYDVGNISPEFHPAIDEDLSFLDRVK